MKRFGRFLIAWMLLVMIVFNLPAFAADDTNPDPYQRIVITLLSESIHQAVEDHYGGPHKRGIDLFSAVVSELAPLYGWSKFNVTVQVQSFVGAHNPPHALEIMTFYVTLGEDPALINYEQKDYP